MSSPGSRGMATAITVLIAIGVVGIVLAKRATVHGKIHEPLQRRANAIVAELKAKGVPVGEPQVVENIDGVEQVVALDVGGRKIRLLEFDASDAAQSKELRRVHDDHTTHVLGKDQPAEEEAGVVIIDYEDHPEKERILEAFHKGGAGDSGGKP